MCNLNFPTAFPYENDISCAIIQKCTIYDFLFSLIIQAKKGHDINIETPNFFTLGKKRKLLVHMIASTVKLQKWITIRTHTQSPTPGTIVNQVE